MWNKGAVVVVKRGDAAIADNIAKSLKVQTTPEIARDYNIMRISHTAKIEKALAECPNKYGQPAKPTPKPLEYLQVGYAMMACGFEAALNGVIWLLKRIDHGIGLVAEWIVEPPKPRKRRKKRRAASRRKQIYY